MTPAGHSAELGVIADDFTGALDAGVEFVRAGFSTALLLRPPHPTDAVHVINTDSRDGAAADAVERVTAATRQLGGHRVFKKIDSTMRGHVGAEIAAVLDTAGMAKALVCPAAPAAGRTVVAGQLLVHGAPLHATHFAADPRWPARSAELTLLVGLPATHTGLAVVRSGISALRTAIEAAPTRVVTLDAETNSDLALISTAAIASSWLPCGSLGLARVWAQQLAPNTPAPMAALPTARDRPVLIVAGSRHPLTREQIGQLLLRRALVTVDVDVVDGGNPWLRLSACLSAGQSVVLRPAPRALQAPALQRQLVETLGALAARACAEFELGGLVLTGGETASAVCRLVGAAGVSILGDIAVGIPWGIVRGGDAHGLPIITKAGGFGGPDALEVTLEKLAENTEGRE